MSIEVGALKFDMAKQLQDFKRQLKDKDLIADRCQQERDEAVKELESLRKQMEALKQQSEEDTKRQLQHKDNQITDLKQQLELLQATLSEQTEKNSGEVNHYKKLYEQQVKINTQ